MTSIPAPTPQQSPPRSAAGKQGIDLRTRFFVLDWTLNLTHTTVVIDGHQQELPWGEHFIPLEAGQHEVQVCYPCLRRPEGKASAMVDIAENHVTRVSYRAPRSVVIAFRPGKLSIEPEARAAG
jgi:hypothetical protein